MTKRLVEVADEDLEAAREALQTTTIRETVTAALRLAAAQAARRMRSVMEPDPLRAASDANLMVAIGRFRPEALEEAYRRLVLRDHVRFVSGALPDLGEPGTRADAWRS